MSKPTLITQDEADQMLATWAEGRDEIIERSHQRMRELAPSLIGRDQATIEALIKAEADRVSAELIQLGKELIEPTEH